MLLGVLDIGSNSAQLQVFEVRPGAPLPTHAVKQPTLLGEAFDQDGAWIPRLAMLSAGQRADLRGVSRSRSGQILAGAVVAKAAMKTLNVESVDVCPWALREGIILHYLQTTHNESFDLPLRPLTGSAYQDRRAGPRGNGHIALVAKPAPARR